MGRTDDAGEHVADRVFGSGSQELFTTQTGLLAGTTRRHRLSQRLSGVESDLAVPFNTTPSPYQGVENAPGCTVTRTESPRSTTENVSRLTESVSSIRL